LQVAIQENVRCLAVSGGGVEAIRENECDQKGLSFLAALIARRYLRVADDSLATKLREAHTNRVMGLSYAHRTCLARVALISLFSDCHERLDPGSAVRRHITRHCRNDSQQEHGLHQRQCVVRFQAKEQRADCPRQR
jgi:hypothetical protein